MKWPGAIEPGSVEERMFSIMDFLPTFATVLGGDLPDDRPNDGADQIGYLAGDQEHSNRDSLITVIGDRIAAVRWNQWRIYPSNFGQSGNSPSLGGSPGYMNETEGYPMIFNIEADRREMRASTLKNTWSSVPTHRSSANTCNPCGNTQTRQQPT